MPLYNSNIHFKFQIVLYIQIHLFASRTRCSCFYSTIFAKVVIKVVIPFVIILLKNSKIVTRYNNYNILDLTYETDERTFTR